jgi:hypothetical protein
MNWTVVLWADFERRLFTLLRNTTEVSGLVSVDHPHFRNLTRIHPWVLTEKKFLEMKRVQVKGLLHKEFDISFTRTST